MQKHPLSGLEKKYLNSNSTLPVGRRLTDPACAVSAPTHRNWSILLQPVPASFPGLKA
jgi:hypothetical protein